MAGAFNQFVPPGTVKQGYLIKSPPLDKKLKLDGWRRRWCVFTVLEKNPCLDYYKSEEEAFTALPIKRVSLLSCYQIVSDMKHKQKKHIFALHLPERVFYFSAPSHVQMLEWVNAFCANLKLSPTDGGTMPGTPPIHRSHLSDAMKSATLPSPGAITLSPSSPILPRSRTPDSPLPPIPQTPDSPLPHIPRSPDFLHRRPPDIPIPPTPLEASSLNSKPNTISSSSIILMSQSAPLSRQGKENGGVKEGSRVSISVNPPALPPHRPSAFDDADDDDDTDDTDTGEEPLSPPTPPPRRSSPVPPMSPPTSLPFEMDMDMDSPPPALPPRIVGNSPLHSVT